MAESALDPAVERNEQTHGMPEDRLNEWFRSFPAYTVGGSLYAVDAQYREAAAVLLHQKHCRIHLDVIVGPQGHLGLTWDELRRTRAVAPDARADLHYICLGEPDLAAERRAVEICDELGLEAIAMPAAALLRQQEPLRELRRRGLRVFTQIGVDDDGTDGLLDFCDGALVMFIEPGTKQAADPGILAKLDRLSTLTSVAVDGGIDEALARLCYEQGARYLVSGRDLLACLQGA